MSPESPQREQFQATRVIAVPVGEAFALLADPSRHHETSPTDWVRDAVDPKPITGVGEVFVVDMFLERIGGDYVMHNEVVEFEQDRVIAWKPGQLNRRGELRTGGWIWRYELEPVDDASTRVTLTYDWTETPQKTREGFANWPVLGEDLLEESLATLERSLTA